MSTTLNPIINKEEVNALKEIIFARARERNKAMTDNVQADIMDIARNSFVSSNNPFSAIAKESGSNTNTSRINTVSDEIDEVDSVNNEIGFPQRKAMPQVVNHNQLIDEQISDATIQNTMQSAREELSNKKSFMGALSFLNSQAAVSLIQTRAKHFEMIV